MSVPLRWEPDPLLEPIFRNMDGEHPKHVAAWLAETFGGPPMFTRDHGGYGTWWPNTAVSASTNSRTSSRPNDIRCHTS